MLKYSHLYLASVKLSPNLSKKERFVDADMREREGVGDRERVNGRGSRVDSDRRRSLAAKN